MAKYALGLKSVKFGTPTGTATMPAVLEAFAQTVKGSMTISETEASVNDFTVEEQDAPVEQIITDNSKWEAVWKCYNISSEILTKVKGGESVTGASETTWKAPASSSILKLAMEIETTSGAKFQVPRASVVARFDGTVGKDDMLQLEVKATALDPGDGGSSYMVVNPD